MAKNNTKTKVSVIILTINSKEMFVSTMENISTVDTRGLDVHCIVVDNGSTDGTIDFASNYKLRNMKYKFIETGKNLGFAGGNNVGIRESLKLKSDYTIILNDDVIVPNNLIVKLVQSIKNFPKAGAISPKIYFAKGYEYHKDRYTKKELGKVIWYAGGDIDWDNIYASHHGVDEVDKGQYDEVAKTDFASGSCVIINNEVFRKIGFLDEFFFLYWEDNDFCQKLFRSGYEVLYYPKIAIWHKVSASAGGSGSKSNDYFIVRNRFFFAMRYAKIRTKFAILRDTVRLMFMGRDWQRLGAFHALIGRTGIGPWMKK